jgi:hypothetical protein
LDTVVVAPNVICGDPAADAGALWPSMIPTLRAPSVTTALPPMMAANIFALLCMSQFPSVQSAIKFGQGGSE